VDAGSFISLWLTLNADLFNHYTSVLPLASTGTDRQGVDMTDDHMIDKQSYSTQRQKEKREPRGTPNTNQ
jgi:hypothetical protein